MSVVVTAPLLPFKFYFLIGGSMKILYGYIHFIWNLCTRIFQMVLCVSRSDILLYTCHMCITYLFISQFSASWFRVAIVIAFSNCSLSLTFLGRNQPRFLTVDMAMTCVLVFLCFQNSPNSPLILPTNHPIENHPSN